MAESISHMQLVNRMYSYVCQIVPAGTEALVMVDKPEILEKPIRTADNFTPDLYYRARDLIVFGEAKTDVDLERKHSLAQFNSYYAEAMAFDGKAVIVISVPWFVKNTAKNIMRRIKNKAGGDVAVHFVTELDGVETI